MRATCVSSKFLVWILAGAAWLVLSTAGVQAQSLKLEAELLWGTNDKTSPNPKHTPVSAEIEKKLKDLPLKWTHYFVVNRTNFSVAQLKASKVSLSDHCTIEVKDLGKATVEISHFGKGERVWTGKQSRLPGW